MPDRYLGQLLGNYRTSRFLGSGSFSWVYEATDTRSGAVVAVKILRPEFQNDKSTRSRFNSEVETASRLRHPNIIAIRETGEYIGSTGPVPFVVMELLPLSLARRLELVHRLPESEVVRIGLEVAAALSIAHSAGVVHRDIKPDNILLAPDGRAVVTDFGLAIELATGLDPDLALGLANDAATDANATRSPGQVLGTPHYFSPEQAQGHQADGRSDLYSLGVTMYRAATGTLPFDADKWEEVATKHIEQAAPDPRELVPELTPEFAAVVDALLAKDPDDRIQSATRLIDALVQLPSAPAREQWNDTAGDSGATLVAPVPLSAVNRVQKRSTRIKVSGAILALMLVLVTFALVRHRRVEAEQQRAAEQHARDSIDAARAALAAIADSIAADSARADSAQRARFIADSIAAASNTDRDRTTHVTIEAPANATLALNGRRVTAGTPTVVSPGQPVRIGGRIADAPQGCRTAATDTTVTLSAGETRTVKLALRGCGNVTIDASPKPAVITIVSADDGVQFAVRADTAASLLIPIGRYSYSATLAGYHDFRDGEFTVRAAPAPAALLRVRLLPK